MTTAGRRGWFITFEGPEGSGKSLQARRLVERLRAAGRTVTATREPGGTPLGDELRRLILLRPDLAPTETTQSLMINAARAQHVERLIRPALARGDVVVCDRFGDSTLAYQGSGSGLALEPLAAVVRFATGGLAPDLTLLLDLPVADGLARKRRQSESDAGAGAWNHFEAASLAFHERVRGGYHALARREPHRWITYDALLPPDVLADHIWQDVAARLTP